MLRIFKVFMIFNIIALLLGAAPAVAYQAVIFDCDGVLVDTEHLKFLAWQQSLANISIGFQESEYLPLVGHSSETIAKKIQQQKKINFNAKTLIAEKEKIYTAIQKKGVPPMQDGVNFLKNLITQKKTLGIKLAIVSSAPHPEILENLQQLGISSKDFDAILSGGDDLKHIHDPEGTNKPKPYIYQLAAEKLNVKPEQCLVFEDSGAGVIAAATAGMKVIAVPNAYTENHDFSLAMKKVRFNEIEWQGIMD